MSLNSLPPCPPLEAFQKRCPHCGITKPFEEYHKHKDRKNNIESWCKVCKNDWDRKHSNYYLWRKNCEEIGIPTDTCMICEKCVGESKTKMDHDHSITPKEESFRSVLCGHCNSCAGQFGDSPEGLRKAADIWERNIAYTQLKLKE